MKIIKEIWDSATVKDINENFNSLNVRAKLAEQKLSGDAIIKKSTALGNNEKVSVIHLDFWGLAFKVKKSCTMLSFDIYIEPKQGTSEADTETLEIVLSDFVAGQRPTYELKSKLVTLQNGWNTVKFEMDLEEGHNYALCIKNITKKFNLGRGGIISDLLKNKMTNIDILEPISAYNLLNGNTSTAYLYFFNIQVTDDLISRLVLNYAKPKFIISDTPPKKEGVLWLKPTGEKYD
ncbi:hypothetical protein [Siminovitchia terrae]|uniref:hypothetical protein n=1 Tax=Siminovitchia terrae TaxID=1914933 RepID=UPI0028ADDBDF|nr:hypothetical protein [Siminovitchia terrae]